VTGERQTDRKGTSCCQAQDAGHEFTKVTKSAVAELRKIGPGSEFVVVPRFMMFIFIRVKKKCVL